MICDACGFDIVGEPKAFGPLRLCGDVKVCLDNLALAPWPYAAPPDDEDAAAFPGRVN